MPNDLFGSAGASAQRALAIYEGGIRFIVMDDVTVSASGATEGWNSPIGLTALVLGATVTMLAGTDSPSLEVKMQTSSDDVSYTTVHASLGTLLFTDSDEPGTVRATEDSSPTIAEIYWRLSWTVSGTNPSFQIQNAGIAVALGGLL